MKKNLCLLFSYKETRCITVASPKEQLYEQVTSNPVLTERNILKAKAYLLDSRPEQKSLVTYYTLPSFYVCVWLVNTLTSTAIGSPIICMRSPADICEQWERDLSFSSADVSGARTCDEPYERLRGRLYFEWFYWLFVNHVNHDIKFKQIFYKTPSN